MDNDDMYEKFEITDYDLDNEFNPNRGRKQTKEQQIYGIWAEEEDDSDDDDRKKRSKDKNFSKGISFVPSESSKNEANDDSKIERNEEEDDFFTRPSFSSNKSKNKADDNSKIERNEEEDDFFTRPSFSSNKSKWKQKNDLQNEQDKLRAFDSKFADFEKNTTGIGSKLLLKMGFKPGQGLGKNLQGISAPIELKARKGKGAISYYGDESNNVSKPSTKSEIDKKSSTKLTQKKPRDSGRYFDKPKIEKKINYVYLEDDLVPKTDDSKFNKLKIIDMTGPEEKVFEGYQEIHKKFNSSNTRKFEFDENDDDDDFEREMKKRTKSQFDYEMDRLEELNDEKIRCEKEIDFYEHRKQSLELIIEKTSSFNSIKDLSPIIDICEQLIDNELRIELFHTFGFPALKHELRNWRPFDELDKYHNEFKRIFDLFNCKREFYDQIFWDCWVPYVRMSIETFDDMRKSEKMIKFFDFWSELVSKWILDNLINQHVVMKLNQAVIDWNPMTDEIPIHYWIHPWLPKINTHEHEIIIKPIRDKLSNAFKQWHPRDPTGKIILQPWRHAFGANNKNWNSFIKENIVPRLETYISRYFIVKKDSSNNAIEQQPWLKFDYKDSEPLNSLFDWREMIAETELIIILKNNFFPNWLKVLYNWLNNKPDYKEVRDWYLGWKSKFPSEWFNKELVVCQGFTVALRMIEFCIDTNGEMISFNFIN